MGAGPVVLLQILVAGVAERHRVVAMLGATALVTYRDGRRIYVGYLAPAAAPGVKMFSRLVTVS
jgi:hypothetical protein